MIQTRSAATKDLATVPARNLPLTGLAHPASPAWESEVPQWGRGWAGGGGKGTAGQWAGLGAPGAAAPATHPPRVAWGGGKSWELEQSAHWCGFEAEGGAHSPRRGARMQLQGQAVSLRSHGAQHQTTIQANTAICCTTGCHLHVARRCELGDESCFQTCEAIFMKSILSSNITLH